MKLCITGTFGNKDVGDDAMLTCWLAFLKYIEITREEIWLVGHQPHYMAWYFDHPIERCIASRDFPKGFPVAEMDRLLVTGGGSMNTRPKEGGAGTRRMYQLVSPFFGKPIFISGQTIGPLGVNPDDDAKVKEIVEHADWLTTRDSTYSVECLGRLDAWPKQMDTTVDDAAGLPCARASLPDNVLGFLAQGPVAAVNLDTYTGNTPQHIAAIGQAVKHLMDKGWRIVFVPHHMKDTHAFRYMLPSLDKKNALLLSDVGLRAEQCKRVIALCDLAMGGRYHFVVFAASVRTPVVGLAGSEYSYIKQHGFLRAIGLGGAAVQPSEVFDPAALIKVVDVVTSVRPTAPVPKSTSFDHFAEWIRG